MDLQNINTWKTSNPIKKWAKDLNKQFSKEDIQRTHRYKRKYSKSLAIGAEQCKWKPQ